MRLIDADALIEAVENTDWYHINREGKLVSGARSDLNPLYKAEDMYKVVDEAPSIDIVRCKECKHWHNADIPYCGKANYGYGWKANDFCSYGEPKGEE